MTPSSLKSTTRGTVLRCIKRAKAIRKQPQIHCPETDHNRYLGWGRRRRCSVVVEWKFPSCVDLYFYWTAIYCQGRFVHPVALHPRARINSSPFVAPANSSPSYNTIIARCTSVFITTNECRNLASFAKCTRRGMQLLRGNVITAKIHLVAEWRVRYGITRKQGKREKEKKTDTVQKRKDTCSHNYK